MEALDATVSLTRAGELLGVSGEWVRKLIAKGHLTRTDNGVKPLDAFHGYIKFLKDDGRRTSKTATASRVQIARAREIELKIAERKGELIDIVEHRDLFAEVFGMVKLGLDGVPAQVTSDVAQRGKIEAAIESVLRRAADRFEAATADLSAGREAAAADPADDA